MQTARHPLLSCSSLLAALCLAACSAAMNPIGAARFDCNRKQDAKSQYCRSFKAVEASTAGPVPPSRFDRAFTLSELDQLSGISPDAPTRGAGAGPQQAARARLPHQEAEEPALEGLPLRQGPVIQRIWIKRFVDGRDVLTENTFVYREIQGTRWTGLDASPDPAAQPLAAYPHRSASEPEGAAAPKNAPEASALPHPEFKQPGAPAGPYESATVPAASGTPTMPQ